jgi:fluoride exporter
VNSKDFLYVFIAGGFGSVLRYALSQLWIFKNNNAADTIFTPTLLVNIVGSFLIGVIMAYALKVDSFNTNYKLLLATGFCGGFTTFSALSNETFLMLKQNNISEALLYILVTIILGILATFIGYKIV